MGTRTSYDAGPARAPEGLGADCGFPTCEGHVVTEHGMCELHKRVAISRTGSWLEAG